MILKVVFVFILFKLVELFKSFFLLKKTIFWQMTLYFTTDNLYTIRKKKNSTQNVELRII